MSGVKDEWINALEALIRYADKNAPDSWQCPTSPTRQAIMPCRELLAELRSAPAAPRPTSGVPLRGTKP
jgi:hypothetical protein